MLIVVCYKYLIMHVHIVRFDFHVRQIPFRGDRGPHTALPHLVEPPSSCFLALFPGCDLVATSRSLCTLAQPWFLRSQRKGRHYRDWNPIHALTPVTLCPHQAILAYLQLTQEITGNALFVLLSVPQRPLSADRINSITTKFLRENSIKDFMAHSTRSAAASALIALGVDPHVVCALGDWKSYDCFRKFYDRVGVLRPIAQAMIPFHLRAAGGGPSIGLVLCDS